MTDEPRTDAINVAAGQALMERAQAYMKAGPGKVGVERINHIDDVQALRACREQLTPAEQDYVATTIEQVTQHLRGIETSAAFQRSKEKERGWRLLLSLLNPTTYLSMNSGKESLEKAEYNRTRSQAGAAKLPPPAGMTAAAEAWLIAALVEGRTTVDTASLRRPWETITING